MVVNFWTLRSSFQALSAIVTGKNGKMRIVRFDAACALALVRYLQIRKNHKHSSSPMLWAGVDGPLHSNAVYLCKVAAPYARTIAFARSPW